MMDGKAATCLVEGVQTSSPFDLLYNIDFCFLQPLFLLA